MLPSRVRIAYATAGAALLALAMMWVTCPARHGNGIWVPHIHF